MFTTAFKSEKGSRSEVNEDAYLALPSIGFFAVADGVGSGVNSDDAARKTIDVLLQELTCYVADEENIKQAISQANQYIFQNFPRHSKNTACTLSAILISDNRARCFHVGDSRIYQLRENELEQITKDHVQAITHDGIKNKNVLTRAVGSEANIEIDVQELMVAPGDLFVLMTDGISDKLSNEAIEEILCRPTVSLAQKANILLQTAQQLHSTDDKTVVLVCRDKG